MKKPKSSRSLVGLWHTLSPFVWVRALLLLKNWIANIERLCGKSVFSAIHGGHHLVILIQYGSPESIGTGSNSCDQYTVLSVQFENDMLCNMNRNRRLLKMFLRLVFDDKRGFLRQYSFLMIVDGQDGH